MPYRRRYSGKRKRSFRRRRTYKKRKFSRRGRAASRIQKTVRSMFLRKRARRRCRSIAVRRSNRRLNSAYTSTKVQTYARTLPQSMMFPETYYNQISGSDGVVGVDATTGSWKCCLQSGMGFFDASVVNAQCSPVNTKFIQDASTHRQVELISVKYTLIPWNGQFTADESGTNIDVPLSPCAPQPDFKAGQSKWHGLMLFYHLDDGKYLDTSQIINQTAPVSSGTTTKFSLGSTTSSLTDPNTKLRVLNSEQRRSFSITVYPARYGTELWDRKIDILTAVGNVDSSYRCGGSQRVDTEDLTNFFAGNFAGPQAPNNQALYSAVCALPPLSMYCQGFPIPIDETGRNVVRPLFKIIQQVKVRWIGSKSFNRGGTVPP